jgi:hypothetical protein
VTFGAARLGSTVGAEAGVGAARAASTSTSTGELATDGSVLRSSRVVRTSAATEPWISAEATQARAPKGTNVLATPPAEARRAASPRREASPQGALFPKSSVSGGTIQTYHVHVGPLRRDPAVASV